MSASRSSTTVTPRLRGGRLAADVSTCFARCAVSTQRIDSRSASGRLRCGVGFTPARVQTSPPTRPRQARVAASTACPCEGGGRSSHAPARRTHYLSLLARGRGDAAPPPSQGQAVVGTATSLVSCTARTCRPATARLVRSDHPSISFAAVTFGLAKNRPARNSPPRLPPSRRKQTVLHATIRSRIAPPFIEAQIPE